MDNDFDENGELVVRDIPDDVIAEIEGRAALQGWSVDEELRATFLAEYGPENG